MGVAEMGSIGEEVPKAAKLPVEDSREEKILVLVRLRPLSEKEIASNETSDWECINETTILYRNTLREGSTYPSAYSFDRVFRGDCSTRQVYDNGVKEVALSVVRGVNSSIFAYGQTSSGKTYTMDGITEYTVSDIFDYIHMHEERAFVLKFSAIEIYNEAIRDLLSADTSSLRLLDDQEKGTVVEKVTEETLKDWNHLQELLSLCEAQRRIGETSLNEKSSRSHQILRLTIESSDREFINKENSATLSASVNFVDLAGSERASQALSSGTRLKEGCHINRSLLTLGTVIRKLSKGRNGHINYRDSKLTRLLQPALGGNARTAIICTLSPSRSHVEQTRNTLLFACCAKEVTTKAQVNVVMSDKALVKHLQRELARLESELRTPLPPSSNGDYAALLKKKDLQIQKMEKEIKDLTKQRDLAESRVQDLLRMIGRVQSSRKEASYSLEDDCSISESSGFVYSHTMDESAGSIRYPRNGEALYQESNGDRAVSDSSITPFHGRIRQHRFSEETNGFCKEVQCIEMENPSRENEATTPVSDSQDDDRFALTVTGNGDVVEEGMSSNRERQLTNVENGLTYDILEQRLHHVDSALDDLISPEDDKPSSGFSVVDSSNVDLPRSWSCRQNILDNFESTPPNGLATQSGGKPDDVSRKLSPLNYDLDCGRLSRTYSQSSLGSAYTDDLRVRSTKAGEDEEIPSVQTFVSELKDLANQEFQKEHGDQQEAEMEPWKNMKDVSLNPMHEGPELATLWSMEFESKQKEIIELWQKCHVSLVHRTYFFLLFKGDPTDSIYLEVEHKRLSFLYDTFSQGNDFGRGDLSTTLASSIKSLNRERLTLTKLMQRRLSEAERRRLYEKWGIALNSKRRRAQLVNLLWSRTEERSHIIESASIIAKLVRFVEQGKAIHGMFGLSFAPPSVAMKRRALTWSYSRASLT